MMISQPTRRSLLVSTVLLALALAANVQAGNMTYDAAVSDALAVTAHRPELSVMRIAGESMLPFFGNNAVVVVKKIDAARLRTGMIAVYVNRFGEKIAHRVSAPAAPHPTAAMMKRIRLARITGTPTDAAASSSSRIAWNEAPVRLRSRKNPAASNTTVAPSAIQ